MSRLRLTALLAVLVSCKLLSRASHDASHDTSHAPHDASHAPHDASTEAPAAQHDASTEALDASNAAHVTRHLERVDGGVLAGLDGGARRARPTRRVTVTAGGGPGTVIATPTGALWVRAVNHEQDQFADVVATAIDQHGEAAFETRLLRRTTGPVRAISASVSGAHLWVSWITLRPTSDDVDDGPYELISAGLHASADLAGADEPVTLDDVRMPTLRGDRLGLDWWPDIVTRAFARPDGGALIISVGGVERTVIPPDRVPVHLAMWNVFRVGADRSVTKDAHSSAAPVMYPEGFVALADGVYYVITDGLNVRGSGIEWAPFARGGDAHPSAPAPDIHSQGEIVIAWNGSAFATRGTLAMDFGNVNGESYEGFALFDEHAAIRTPFRNNPQDLPAPDGVVAWTPYTLAPPRCAHGHPVATVRWRASGGGTFTLDASDPQQRFALEQWIAPNTLPLPPPVAGRGTYVPPPEHLVWAGSALVGLVNGELTRWTCAGSGPLTLAR